MPRMPDLTDVVFTRSVNPVIEVGLFDHTSLVGTPEMQIWRFHGVAIATAFAGVLIERTGALDPKEQHALLIKRFTQSDNQTAQVDLGTYGVKIREVHEIIYRFSFNQQETVTKTVTVE
jgi:hypothetical protein